MSRQIRWSNTPLLAAVALAPLFTACGGTGGGVDAPPAVDITMEAESLMELDLEWAQRFADGDIEWIAALQAENAVFLAPGAERLEGREAIREAWIGMLEIMPGASWEPVKVHVASSGDLAYTYGTASVPGPDGMATPWKYLEVWTKVNGEWKVAADIFNASFEQAM